jgi:hypothetical protein
MWIFKAVLSFFFGPLVTMFKGVMDYRTQKAIVQGEVAKESIKANVQLSQIKKEMHQINMGWWATRWIVPLIAYPIIAWWGCVWADTIFQFPNWSVPAPPEPIYSWSGEIIMSFFIVRGAEMVTSAVTTFSTAGAITDIVRNAFNKK